MKTAHEHVTMDGTELRLLERYEVQFGETPPVHFLTPHDTRAIQGWLGHRSITSTAVYTALAPNRFRDLWR
jgi:hypothetical protein